MINRTYYRLARVLLFISLTASQLDIFFGCVCHLVTYLFLQQTLEVAYYRQQRLFLITGVLCYTEVTANEHVDLTEWLWFLNSSCAYVCLGSTGTQLGRQETVYNYCRQAEVEHISNWKKSWKKFRLKRRKATPPFSQMGDSHSNDGTLPPDRSNNKAVTKLIWL